MAEYLAAGLQQISHSKLSMTWHCLCKNTALVPWKSIACSKGMIAERQIMQTNGSLEIPYTNNYLSCKQPVNECRTCLKITVQHRMQCCLCNCQCSPADHVKCVPKGFTRPDQVWGGNGLPARSSEYLCARQPVTMTRCALPSAFSWAACMIAYTDIGNVGQSY